MDYVTVAIGASIALVGLFNLVNMFAAPLKVKRLQVFKGFLGAAPGSMLFFCFYFIAPAAIGAAIAMAGVEGNSVSQVISMLAGNVSE